MSLSSDELNYLMYRYLQESGFVHSAFAFGHESHVVHSTINAGDIPPGALIALIIKGLQYVEVEANLQEDGMEAAEPAPFSLVHLTQRACGGDPADAEEPAGAGAPAAAPTAPAKEAPSLPTPAANGGDGGDGSSSSNVAAAAAATTVKAGESDATAPAGVSGGGGAPAAPAGAAAADPAQSDPADDGAGLEPAAKRIKTEAMAVDEPSAAPASPSAAAATASAAAPLAEVDVDVASAPEVDVLRGHTCEVFVCSWNPAADVIASGSGDSTVRLWRGGTPDAHQANGVGAGSADPIVLRHDSLLGAENKVTTLDWNRDGTLLATGSFDGQMRVWNAADGSLRCTLAKHSGPIFSLRWNKKGDLLLSGCVDKTAIVWDPATQEVRQRFDCHSDAVLDVDWRGNKSFATCSEDRTINVCKLGEAAPVKTYAGHAGTVNAIRWDPSGTLLASCSDDCSLKVWNVKRDGAQPQLDLPRAHDREIYTIRWSPTDGGTLNGILASASFDHTIKLHDVASGACLQTLAHHADKVYSVAFSPDGRFLASGSPDRTLNVWATKSGRLVRSYRGDGTVFEVSWSRGGDQIAACTSGASVYRVAWRGGGGGGSGAP